MSLGQDLADFLLARIAEDEAMARWLADFDDVGEWSYERIERDLQWMVGSSTGPQILTGYVGNSDSRPAAEHIARHDPARVLADCTAKRKIVEELRTVSAHADTEYDSGRVCAFTASLLLLADVYADHPDYDQTWRP